MSGSSGSSLEDALKMVAAACLTGGDALGRTRTMIRVTMLSQEAPPPIQSLGSGLLRVLDGQRGEAATAGLSPDVVPLVQSVLGMIEQGQKKK
jgi:hypothetical protein